MTKSKILVTGATGKTGTQIVVQLLEKGWPVRAVVHKSDARSERLERLGAEIVIADLYDYEQMSAAVKGTSRAYFCPPVQPFMIQAATLFAIVAQEAKLEAVVSLSQWFASPAHPSLHTRQLWLVEKLFAKMPGVSHTLVNPGPFAEPFLLSIPGAANMGSYPSFFGEFRNAPPSNEDIARVVVAVLMDPLLHTGKRYRPTGPKLISMPDIVDAVSRVTGRKVKLQEFPKKMFFKAARSLGFNAFEIASTGHYIDEARTGAAAVNAPTTDVFDLTGREPEDIETIARRYAKDPRAQRTIANKLAAIREFIGILTTPGMNAEKYEREMGFPVPSKAILSGKSPIWKREHQTNGRVDAPRSAIVDMAAR